MTTITDDHAHAILLHAAQPPAIPLLDFMLAYGPRRALDLVLESRPPTHVKKSFRLPLSDVRHERDTLTHDHAALLTPQDHDWPADLPCTLPGSRSSTDLLALWVYGRAPLAALAGGVGVFGPESPTLAAHEAAVALARRLASRNVPLITAGVRGIAASVLEAALALRQPMTGRLVVVVTADDIHGDSPTDQRLLKHVRAAGGLIVHDYPSGGDIPATGRLTRNRLAAGLARAAVVLEADDDALVSAHTADLLGRSVFVPRPRLAIPETTGDHSLVDAAVAAGLYSFDQLTTSAAPALPAWLSRN